MFQSIVYLNIKHCTTNQQEAATSDHAREWKAAVDSEYNSLIENKTWKVVEVPWS